MSGFSTPGLPAAAFPLTGNEAVAADTQLTGGLNPESEAITVSQMRGFYRAPVVLTDAAVISLDASKGDLYQLTLTGNHTLANPTNLQAGQSFRVEVTQDTTGTRTLTFGSLYKWAAGSAPTLTTTASAIDMLSLTYDGAILLGSEQYKFS